MKPETETKLLEDIASYKKMLESQCENMIKLHESIVYCTRMLDQRKKERQRIQNLVVGSGMLTGLLLGGVAETVVIVESKHPGVLGTLVWPLVAATTGILVVYAILAIVLTKTLRED